MSKSAKKIIALATALLLLGGLIGALYFLNSLPEQEPAEPTPFIDNSVALVSRLESDIQDVTIITESETLVLRLDYSEENGEYIWSVATDPDIPIIQYNASNMARAFYSLTATEMVAKSIGNPGEYGLAPPKALLHCNYRDGSSATLYVGNATPEKDKTYFMLEGDPALYLMYEYLGARYSMGANFIINKELPEITLNRTDQILIKERGRPQIEFEFHGTQEEKMEMLNEYGALTMFMVQPYAGREIFYQSFQYGPLGSYPDIYLNDLVELYPDDYAKYGLDDPLLEFLMRDLTNTSHMLFGDDADEDGQTVYCKMYDKPYVFTVNKSFIWSLLTIDVFAFIERNVALVDIRHLVSLEIDDIGDPDRSLEFLTNYAADPDGDEPAMWPTVNGKPIEAQKFRLFYRALLSIYYEVEIEEFTPTQPPLLTMTFTMDDGSDTHVRFYRYDANFYAVSRDDYKIQFVSSRKTVDDIYAAAQKMFIDTR